MERWGWWGEGVAMVLMGQACLVSMWGGAREVGRIVTH